MSDTTIARAIEKAVRYAAHPADLETWHRTISPHEDGSVVDQDGTPRLAYADFLEESGNPAVAEVVRGHVADELRVTRQEQYQKPRMTYRFNRFARLSPDQATGFVGNISKTSLGWMVLVAHPHDGSFVVHLTSDKTPTEAHDLVRRLREEGVPFPEADEPNQELHRRNDDSLAQQLAAEAAASGPKRMARTEADAVTRAFGGKVKYALGGASHEAVQSLLAQVLAGRHDLAPILADALKDRDEHHDAATLWHLRSGKPVYQHPTKSGKYAFRPWPKLTISDIRRINRERGGNYFNPDTMRFFGSQLERRVHQGPGGTFFVQSTDNFDRTGRQWKVEHFSPETGDVRGWVHDSGDPAMAFSETVPYSSLVHIPEEFGSREAAHAAAAHLAAHGRLPDHSPEQMSRRTRPAKLARQTPLYSAEHLHPELRFTRLGAVLRQVASSDPDPNSAHLDPVISLARHAIEAAGPHDQPMDLLPLSVLRDYMLENPEHPLAKRFNWERLPEKVALDRTVFQHRHPNSIVGLDHIIDPRRYPNRGGMKAIHAIIKEHPWASPDNVQESAQRVDSRLARNIYGPSLNPEYTHEQMAEDDRQYWPTHPERYARPQVSGVANALRLLRSRNQQQTRAVAGQVIRSLGLSPAAVRDAVTTDPAPVAAVVASVGHGGDDERGEAAAAYLGHLLQLPAVTAFHVDPQGPDAIHRFTLDVPPAEAARKLAAAGVSRAALTPVGNGTSVIVHDPGMRLGKAVAAVGQAKTTRGRSVSFGGGVGHRADAGARKQYREVMAAWEGKGGKVKMARKPVAVRLNELTPWLKAIDANPVDRVPRGAFADWLEERGLHHDDLTLHLLRLHEGPVFAVRHPRSGKVVAVPGERITSDRDLLRLRSRFNPIELPNHGSGTIIHGPGGIVRIWPSLITGRHSLQAYWPTGSSSYQPTSHESLTAATNEANRIAFGA